MLRKLSGMTLGALLFACAPASAPSTPPGPAVLPSAERDYDGDGFVDPRDRCPRERGEAPLGCPDKDEDGDGLKASVDRCPNFAGPAPDGCPPPDADNDGVANADDKCQGTFETANGFQDHDGCPDEIPKDLTRISGVMKGVAFETDKDVLKTSSHAVLDRVADVLKRHADVRVELSGHTDNTATGEYARDLPKQRADAIKAYLVGKGIEAGRIETRGAGADEPLDTNKTAAGRARNRRVELTILAQ